MNVADTPEGKIALRFSELVVESRYEQAAAFVADEAKEMWNAGQIRDQYTQMVSYFAAKPEVCGEYMVAGFADIQGTHIYVPILGDITSEAIIVSLNQKQQIYAIAWGRP